MNRVLLFLLGLMLLAPSATFAWENPGHRIICQIAWERLTAGGRAIVAEAQALEKHIDDQFDPCEYCPDDHLSDARPMTLQAGCVWPNESRRDTFKGTYEYHFANVSKVHTSFDLNRDCATMDCTVLAIQRYALDLALLKPAGRDREVKALALRFLGHFVGDVHQPLHVGQLEDLAGNRLDVRWKTGSGNTFVKHNLHKVWDIEIMRRGGLTRQAQGVQLNDEITAAEAAAWKNFDIAAWASESYTLARDSAYKNTSGRELELGDELGDPYFERGFPIVKEQLKKAGVRLAFLINSIADGTIPGSMVNLSAP